MNLYPPACWIPSVATSSQRFSILALQRVRNPHTSKPLIQRAFLSYRCSTPLRSQLKGSEVKGMAALNEHKKRLVVACDGMSPVHVGPESSDLFGIAIKRLNLTRLHRNMDGMSSSPLYFRQHEHAGRPIGPAGFTDHLSWDVEQRQWVCQRLQLAMGEEGSHPDPDKRDQNLPRHQSRKRERG